MNKGRKRGYESIMQGEGCTNLETKKINLFCELCKVELPNINSLNQHLLGQKHKKVDNAEEERKRVERKCGIFVKGFPHNLGQDTILNYFSQYGKIVWVHYGSSFVLLDYTEPSAVEQLIKKNHYLGGKQLMIRYRQFNQQVPVKKSDEESNDFVHCLKDISKFDDQVHILTQNLQPHIQSMFPKYRQICNDLYRVLSPVFHYCQIHPFGSTITGLNFSNSDVDVYISGIKKDDNDVPYLYKTKNLLLHSNLFANIIVIRHAKIPILKCIHIQTGISCDINLKNMLGVCNSQLIIYYLNIDPKIRLLMMVLKYWAKVHRITGQNHLFSNYSLTLMLIFFLQQEPYNVPSILRLQQNPQFFNMQDGWNGGFQAIPVKSSLNYISLLKLLENFFTFYINFEYGVNIICPYLGRPVKKNDFSKPNKLSNCFYFYKNYIQCGKLPLKVDSIICIQDPFEHSRNTTPIISASTLNVFVNFCRSGKKLCEEDEYALLYKLLTHVPQNLKSEPIIKPEFSQFLIPMEPGLKYIEEKNDTLESRQKAWFDSFVKFTTVALKDILKFDISDLNSIDSKNKNMKYEGQLDVHAKKEIGRICYKCVTKLNVWQARKPAAKYISETEKTQNGFIEKEIAITNRLCTLYQNVSQVTDIIDFDLTLEQNLEPPEVLVKVKKVAAYKNTFKSFATFFATNLPLWFKTYEKELNCSVQNVNN